MIPTESFRPFRCPSPYAKQNKAVRRRAQRANLPMVWGDLFRASKLFGSGEGADSYSAKVYGTKSGESEAPSACTPSATAPQDRDALAWAIRSPVGALIPASQKLSRSDIPCLGVEVFFSRLYATTPNDVWCDPNPVRANQVNSLRRFHVPPLVRILLAFRLNKRSEIGYSSLSPLLGRHQA